MTKQTKKKIFTDPREAKYALDQDGLGTIYYRAKEVVIVTAFGIGTFPINVWRAANGYDNSMKEKT